METSAAARDTRASSTRCSARPRGRRLQPPADPRRAARRPLRFLLPERSPMKPRYVGQPVTRREDPRLVQGLAHYVDDIRLPDTLHVAFVRSPHAHAVLGAIDASEARTMPGVAGVFTAADFSAIGSVPCAAALEGLRIPPHPVLATGKVRYVGEPVVAVVADDPYRAADAVDRVNVDYQPLPAVVDPEAAASSSAVLVHDQYDDNVAFRWKLAGGDIEAAFA